MTEKRVFELILGRLCGQLSSQTTMKTRFPIQVWLSIYAVFLSYFVILPQTNTLSVFVPPMELDEGIEMSWQRWSDLEDRILKAQQVHGSALEPDTLRDVFMTYLLSVREEFYERLKHG